jgi:hypothetical protein
LRWCSRKGTCTGVWYRRNPIARPHDANTAVVQCGATPMNAEKKQRVRSQKRLPRLCSHNQAAIRRKHSTDQGVVISHAGSPHCSTTTRALHTRGIALTGLRACHVHLRYGHMSLFTTVVVTRALLALRVGWGLGIGPWVGAPPEPCNAIRAGRWPPVVQGRTYRGI